VTLRALTWNLFHGRDFPPDPALLTWRSRLLRLRERNATHLQLNRELLGEFASVLERAEWDVALLQECPPRWHRPLTVTCSASRHGVLTSRNSVSPLRSFAARLNPDLIASNEGGSNLTLVRNAQIVDRRSLELQPGPRPERRAMAFTRLALPGAELCVANLHASAGRALLPIAERELLRAAERSCEWAGDRPLIVGGDLNVRPRDSTVYAELADRFGLAAPTSPSGLDHILARGLDIVDAPCAWRAEEREVRVEGLAVRLSDHAPVETTLALPGRTVTTGATE
jgi:endonuclease/exonuclease/phosphatase family metal-dependent hydrolase